MHFAAWLICLLSFGALALAMERHQEDISGTAFRPALTRGLRAAGWLGLSMALAVLVQGQGWGMGLVSYSGHTSLAAGLVFGALIIQGRLRGGRR